MAIKFLILTLAISTTLLLFPASAQITTPCTPSMITTFTPCMNFVTNSSSNGSTPTQDCCNSLKSLMSSGKDCLCLIATGGIPFQIPNFNRNLGISLPRACNMPGVPVQCKAAAGTPLPAPGPLANGPALSPNSPKGAPAPPEPLAPTSSPEGDGTQSPPSDTTNGSSTTGSRALNPSAAHPSYSASPLLLVAVLGTIALKIY